ncbi:MAG TPA: multidrug effflux MFS transporter [Candidatus Acidoferrum sp.]|nr:multidrug effflux MFS transporter [Candidatus Acidoferrum sp.]
MACQPFVTVATSMRPPNSFPVTALLTALVALGPISTDLYLPSLPGLARYFAVGVDDIQLTLSVFLVGLATAQLVYGPLSDRFGRRPVLLFGLGIYVVASLVCMLSPSVPILVVARFVQAVGACVGPVLGRAVVRDVHGREGAARVLAYMSAAMALAPAIGPILGGFLEEWFGWRSNFLALVLYGSAGLIAAWRILPETNRTPDLTAAEPLRILLGYRGFLNHRAYVGYVLCCAFAYSGIFSFISGSSYVLQEVVGLGPIGFGLCFAGVVIGYIIGTVIAGRLSRQLGIDRLVAVGAGVSVAGGLLLLVLSVAASADTAIGGALLIVGPMLLFMIGVGLVLPNSIAGAIGPFPRAAGAASALLGFTQMTAAAIVGIAVAALYNGSSVPMAAAIAAVALGALLAFLGLVRTAPRGT